jgi:hypothetical protein
LTSARQPSSIGRVLDLYAVLGLVELIKIRAAVLLDTWTSQRKQARIVNAVNGSTIERSARFPRGCWKLTGSLGKFGIRTKELSSLEPGKDARTRSERGTGELSES